MALALHSYYKELVNVIIYKLFMVLLCIKGQHIAFAGRHNVQIRKNLGMHCHGAQAIIKFNPLRVCHVVINERVFVAVSSNLLGQNHGWSTNTEDVSSMAPCNAVTFAFVPPRAAHPPRRRFRNASSCTNPHRTLHQEAEEPHAVSHIPARLFSSFVFF